MVLVYGAEVGKLGDAVESVDVDVRPQGAMVEANLIPVLANEK